MKHRRGVMISVLASSALNRRFESHLVKPNTLKAKNWLVRCPDNVSE